MAKTNYQSIDEYHDAFPPETQARMQAIRNLVHKVAPESTEVISYQIPAFRLGGKFHLIYYCAFARHISISSPWSAAMLDRFAASLEGLKVSRSAIQFQHDKPLPLKLIEDILMFRKAEHEARK